MEDIRMIMKRSCGKGGSQGEKEGGEQWKGGKEEEKWKEISCACIPMQDNLTFRQRV